jgi:hypothetical protein
MQIFGAKVGAMDGGGQGARPCGEGGHSHHCMGLGPGPGPGHRYGRGGPPAHPLTDGDLLVFQSSPAPQLTNGGRESSPASPASQY